MVETITFYVFAGFAILSALSVVFQPKPTIALLSLIITMFCLAVLFILLGAHFVAMVHLIVYAGAVLVLFLFVIMLQGVGATSHPIGERFKGFYLILALLLGFVFLAISVSLIQGVNIPHPVGVNGTPTAIGLVLFQKYLLPFELTSILLLLGIFAAVALAKDEKA